VSKKWVSTLKLDDIFHSEAIGFGNKRDIIVKRIREAVWFNVDDAELGEIVDELYDALDEEDFDLAWNQFYDWADHNRVWVVTS